jgi:PIN domain nuclease of toxin-antitoxin system
MNLLLDKHVCLCAVSEPSRLDRRLRETSADNQSVVSAATPCEIAIKQASGRLEFLLDLFDRMLIAQAVIEELLLVTQHQAILRQDVPVFGAGSG